MLSLSRTPHLWPPPDCLRNKSQMASLYRITIFYNPMLTPVARSLSGPPPTTGSIDFSHTGKRYAGLKRERENHINTSALYANLSQPSVCLYHWWSIKAKERHLQIKDKVMETFFWNTVMEPHCKNIIKKWRFTEHVANKTLPKPKPCTQPGSPSTQSVC